MFPVYELAKLLSEVIIFTLVRAWGIGEEIFSRVVEERLEVAEFKDLAAHQEDIGAVLGYKVVVHAIIQPHQLLFELILVAQLLFDRFDGVSLVSCSKGDH